MTDNNPDRSELGRLLHSLRRKPEQTRACEECGQEFMPVEQWQKFCSGRCKSNHHSRARRAGQQPAKENQP